MCAAFVVGMLNLLLSNLSRRETEEPARSKLALAGLLFCLALGSKELAIIGPILLVPLLWKNGSKTRPLRLRAFVIMMIAAAYVGLRYSLLGGFGLGADYPTDSWLMNLATSATAFWHFAGRSLLPISPTISDAWPVAQQAGPKEVIAIIMLGLLVAGMLWGLKRRFVWAFGLFWFCCWLIPVSGLVPLQHQVADRFLYPAAWGILLSVTSILATCIDRELLPARPTSFGVVAICLLLGYHTFDQSRYWRDDTTLFDHMLQLDPNFAEGHLAMASRAHEDGDYEQAIDHASQAQQIRRDKSIRSYSSPFLEHTYRGLAHYHLRDLKSAESDLLEALRVRPENSIALYHVGLIAMSTGDLTEARGYFESSLKRNPGDRLCRGNLAHVYLLLQQPAACESLLRSVMKADTASLIDLSNYATALLLLHRYDDAYDAFTRLNQSPTGQRHNAGEACLGWREKLEDGRRWVLRRSESDRPRTSDREIRRPVLWSLACRAPDRLADSHRAINRSVHSSRIR